LLSSISKIAAKSIILMLLLGKLVEFSKENAYEHVLKNICLKNPITKNI